VVGGYVGEAYDVGGGSGMDVSVVVVGSPVLGVDGTGASGEPPKV
jgi:hypothetical protein